MQPLSPPSPFTLQHTHIPYLILTFILTSSPPLPTLLRTSVSVYKSFLSHISLHSFSLSSISQTHSFTPPPSPSPYHLSPSSPQSPLTTFPPFRLLPKSSYILAANFPLLFSSSFCISPTIPSLFHIAYMSSSKKTNKVKNKILECTIAGLENKNKDFWRELEEWQVIVMREMWLDEKWWRKVKEMLPGGCTRIYEDILVNGRHSSRMKM